MFGAGALHVVGGDGPSLGQQSERRVECSCIEVGLSGSESALGPPLRISSQFDTPLEQGRGRRGSSSSLRRNRGLFKLRGDFLVRTLGGASEMPYAPRPIRAGVRRLRKCCMNGPT